MAARFLKELGAIIILVVLGLLIWVGVSHSGQTVRVYAVPQTEVRTVTLDEKRAGFLIIGAPGGEELTIALESVTFDGVAQKEAALTAPVKTGMVSDMGGLKVQSRSDGCRVLVPTQVGATSVSVSFLIDSGGMTLERVKSLFAFKSARGDILFLIRRPSLCDAEGNQLFRIPQGEHSIEDAGLGLMRYTKTFAGLDKLELPKDFWIDVDIVYGTTADGYVWLLGYPGTWADGVARSTGDSVSTTDASVYYCPYVQYDAAGNVYINRYFGYFDLSALGGSITAATFNIKTKTQNATGGSLFQGTQAATLAVEDFDSFTGSSFGSASWAVDGNWNVITINAGGLSYLTSVLGSTAKLCLREKDYDVAVVQPPTSNPYYNGIYFADSVGNEPYLEMTLETTTTTTSTTSTTTSTTTTTTSTTTTTTTTNVVNFVTIGDSLIEGVGGGGTTIASCFSTLTGIATYVNSGVSSDTTTLIAGRFQTDVLDYHPDIVIIEGGHIDVITSVPKATFLANWTTILDLAQADPDVFTVMVCRMFPSTFRSNSEMQTFDDWNADLASLAAGYSKAIVVDSSFCVGQFRAGGDAGNRWDIIPAYNNDGVHYNGPGYCELALTIYTAFNGVIPPCGAANPVIVFF